MCSAIPVEFACVRALAAEAGRLIWPTGLFDTAEGRRAQATLYAAALLALEVFSPEWLLGAAEITAAKLRSREPAHQPASYLFGVLRIRSAKFGVPPDALSELMGIADLAVRRHLPPLQDPPHARREEPAETEPPCTPAKAAEITEKAAAAGDKFAADYLRYRQRTRPR
jgi:hypothetical protein